jgi:hypothetical protein
VAKAKKVDEANKDIEGMIDIVTNLPSIEALV